jgi:uncharacterized protein (TIGR03435 family)
MRPLHTAALGVLTSLVIFGQAPPAKLEFEVASVRPSQPVGQNQVAIGLHMDGSQVHILSFTVQDLMARAYTVKRYQVTGPDWTRTERFDLNAKLPVGATSDQIPAMLQAFLADRFQLKMHRDKKEQPVYAITLGKPPLTLKPTPSEANATESKGAVNVAAAASAAGVSVDLGNGSYYTFADNQFDIKKVSMDMLATILERYVERPILNLTDLKGNYDLTFKVTQEDYQVMMIRAAVNTGMTLPPQALSLLDNGSASPLFDAMQQVGLKLDARKAPLELLVIDQVSKTPTDN